MVLMIDAYLFWGAWQDLKSKKIRNEYLWIGGVSGLVFKGIGIINGSALFKDWILALIPGMLLLLSAKITKEKIGFGDGYVFLILGNFLDIIEIWYVLQTAIFLVMFFSVVLLCVKKVTGKYQIPFLPFLWGAYTLLWGISYV